MEVCVSTAQELEAPVYAMLLPVPGGSGDANDFNIAPIELLFSETGEQCANISIEMDGILEDTEHFSIVLSSPSERVSVHDSIAQVYIMDSDCECTHTQACLILTCIYIYS